MLFPKMMITKTFSLLAACAIAFAALAGPAVAADNSDGPMLLAEIQAILFKATNSGKIGADKRGVWQKDATLGRMRSNTLRQKFKDPLLQWDNIDGATLDGGEGDWSVLVSSSRLPLFHIRLGSWPDKDEAQNLAGLIMALARLGGPEATP